MRIILKNWAIRAGARLPELTAAAFLILGVAAASWIMSANKAPRGAGKPALVKPVEVSSKASSSVMQIAGEISER